MILLVKTTVDIFAPITCVPSKNLDINKPIVYDKYLAGFVKKLKA